MAFVSLLLIAATVMQIEANPSPSFERRKTPDITSDYQISPGVTWRLKTDYRFARFGVVAQYNLTTSPGYVIQVKCSLVLPCKEFALGIFVEEEFDVKSYVCTRTDDPEMVAFTSSTHIMYLMFSSGQSTDGSYDCRFTPVKGLDPPTTKPVDPPLTKPVDPSPTKPVDPPPTKPVDPPPTKPVDPPPTTPPPPLVMRKPDFQISKQLKEGDKVKISTKGEFSKERVLARYDFSTPSVDLGLAVECTLSLNCLDMALALFVTPLPHVQRYDCGLDKTPFKVSMKSSGSFLTVLFDSGYSEGSEYNCVITTRPIDPHETTTAPPKPTTVTTTKPLGCQCGDSNTNRIINGSPVKLGEIPWQAGIKSPSDGVWSIFCGGSLVSDKFVVTAKHCVRFETPGNLKVQLGVINRDDIGITVNVRVVRNPTSTTYIDYDYDIAVLKLDRAVDFTSSVYPVCVPPLRSKETFVGRSMTVSGWGRTKADGTESQVLLKTDVVGMTDEACEKIYGKDRLTKYMMCAERKGTDSCKGDSGGPLTYKDQNGVSFLTGIVSWGDGCAEKPGVYVRMTTVMDWFNEQTEKSVCTRTWRL